VELLDDFRILYLTGPRQAGKTTLVKQLAGRLGMKYVTLDDQAVFAAINNDPHGYILSQAGQRLILDEFQSVGWVERNETHQMGAECTAAPEVGWNPAAAGSHQSSVDSERRSI
jgi:energy-coupling factor transporter ATP-binding protein EcfA2